MPTEKKKETTLSVIPFEPKQVAKWLAMVRDRGEPGKLRSFEDVADLAGVMAWGVMEGFVPPARVKEARACVELAFTAIATSKGKDVGKVQIAIGQLVNQIPSARGALPAPPWAGENGTLAPPRPEPITVSFIDDTDTSDTSED